MRKRVSLTFKSQGQDFKIPSNNPDSMKTNGRAKTMQGMIFMNALQPKLIKFAHSFQE